MSTTPETYVASARPLAVFIGQCQHCPRPVRTSSEIFMGDHYPFFCPDCRKPVTLQRLYGTVTKMDCHPDCMSAYGPHCECGCGGVNHGNVWEQSGEMLADYLALYRADRERRREAARKASETREAKRAVQREAETAQRRAEFGAWRTEHMELVTELLATDWLTDPYPNDFLADMRRIAERGEILTENQANAAARTLARRREVRERIAAEHARAADFTDVPTGRQTIRGRIIAAWHADGDWGPMIKIKIDCTHFQVRGTCPKNLINETLSSQWGARDYENLPNVLRGKSVTLSAALAPDGHERGQGYFNRPTKAKFVEPANA